MERARLGVDVGGTFTDLVALVDGALVTAKVPSTPADQARGVLRAVTAADLAATASAFSRTAPPWPLTRCWNDAAPAPPW